MSAARAAISGITVRSNSSARIALNWDWVVTTDAIRVALTSTIASQNDTKIFRNRVRNSDSPVSAYGPIRHYVHVPDIPDGANAFGTVIAGTEFLAQVADVNVQTSVGRFQIAPQSSLDQFFSRYHLSRRFEKQSE